MRANKRVVLDRENTGLSQILYAIRNAPKSNNQSPAKLQLGRKVTTIKDIITTKPTTKHHTVSNNANNFELKMSNFPQDQDSEIMVRDRARGSKLEDTYKQKKGHVFNETQHTLTMKEAGKTTQSKTFRKREITKPQPPLVPQSSQSENVNTTKQKKETKQMKESKQTKTDEQRNPKKRKEKSIPAKFKRLELERFTGIRTRRRNRKTATQKKTNKAIKTIKHANKNDSELGKAKTCQRRTRK